MFYYTIESQLRKLASVRLSRVGGVAPSHLRSPQVSGASLNATVGTHFNLGARGEQSFTLCASS